MYISMRTIVPFIYVFLYVFPINCLEEKSNLVGKSRRKRYLLFPEGTSVAISVCTQAQLVGPSFLTEAVAVGLAYDLPSNFSDLQPLKNIKRFKLKKRNRRELYNNVETIIDSMGYDGKSCIFRAICEASQRYFSKSGNENIIEKILSLIFGFPSKKNLPSETEEYHYHKAYEMGQKHKNIDSCQEFYSEKCHFSLLDMALGDYSAFG